MPNTNEPQTQPMTAEWHAPGLGEVHSSDHRHIIYCLVEDAEGEQIGDDYLTNRVRDALNGAAQSAETIAAKDVEIARLTTKLAAMTRIAESAHEDCKLYDHDYPRFDALTEESARTTTKETIARLEKELSAIKCYATPHRSYRIAAWQANYFREKFLSAKLCNKNLRKVLEIILKDMGENYNEHEPMNSWATMINEVLAQPLDTSALDAYVASRMPVWQQIETAPKDGTVIDLLIDGERITDCYWGLPNHSCGEAGRYCDSDWHSLSDYWVCSIFNEQIGEGATHWMPLPPSPNTQEKE